MGVRGEVVDDLVRGDAEADGGLDGGFGEFGGDEVGVAGAELGEEGEDADGKQHEYGEGTCTSCYLPARARAAKAGTGARS